MTTDVSVLIVSYQPDLEQLKKTVISAIRQKNVIHQIVIADDGSANNYFEEIREVFKKEHFDGYILVPSDTNNGTCHNIYYGLRACTGTYVKTIAPGDYLFDESTLFYWLQQIKTHSADVCFGDTLYYRKNQNQSIQVLQQKRQPQNVNIYSSERFSKFDRVLNYIFLKDVVVGASFLTKKDVMEKYMKLINGKIKYAEDMIYRIMLIEGVDFCYYPSPVVWYEYGTGISTSGSEKWNDIINKERIECNEIIKSSTTYRGLKRRRLCLALDATKTKRTDVLKYFIYPKLVYWKIKKDRCKALTSVNVDCSYIDSLY